LRGAILLMEDWRKRISAVILMTASPEDSMARENGDLPVEGGHGSIMNVKWLSEFRAIMLQTCDRLKGFRVFQVNTSQKEAKDKPKQTAEKWLALSLM